MNDLPWRTHAHPRKQGHPEVEPPLDARELDKRTAGGPFAPEGVCTSCDPRRGWVKAKHSRSRSVRRSVKKPAAQDRR